MTIGNWGMTGNLTSLPGSYGQSNHREDVDPPNKSGDDDVELGMTVRGRGNDKLSEEWCLDGA
jgi:hypothetical protein